MNEFQQYKKPLQYYFHKNEIVRMMRVRLHDAISASLNLTPRYGNDIKVGAVIGTYGCVPQVDLQLHWLKKKNGIENILVHDDCSPEQDELKKLCRDYSVKFYTTPKNMFHKACIGSLGDQNCFYEGLKWAKEKNLDILVKFSRRCIACYRWIDDFKKLVSDSDGVTFSSYCSRDPFPIRTECIGMNVNAWTNDFTMHHFQWLIENEFPTFAEYWMDAMAKQIDWQNFSPKYDIWKRTHHTTQLYSGYVHWYDILGTCRYNEDNRHKDVLWHQYSKDEDYLKKLDEVFPGKYKLDSLNKVVEI